MGVLRANRIAVALSAVALLATVGGGAYAATNSKAITVCVKKHGGSLYKAAKCAKGDTRLSWSQVGPQGPAGVTGAAGAAGAKGTSGASGTNGSNGTNGTNGTNGLGATTYSVDLSNASGDAATVASIGPLSLYADCISSGSTVQLGVSDPSNAAWVATGSYSLFDDVPQDLQPGSPPPILANSYGILESYSDTQLVLNNGPTSASYIGLITGDLVISINNGAAVYDLHVDLQVAPDVPECIGTVTITPTTVAG
jgi:hypothetical protein